MPKRSLAVLAVAFILAACSADNSASSGNTSRVAQVEGEAVSYDDVASLITVEGDTIEPDRFAQILGLVIVGRLIRAQAANDFDLSISETELQLEKERVAGPTPQDQEQFLTAQQLTDEGFTTLLGTDLLARNVGDALVAQTLPPTEEDLQQAYGQNPLDYTEVCASHILLEEESQAQAALERAQAGEDFAELARELSTGPSGPNGGDLGCAPASTYVTEFAVGAISADIDVPYGPVETQFGWHLILVRELTPFTFEEARERIIDNLAPNPVQLWTEWFNEVLAQAQVNVELEYGTWQPQQPFVIPPLP